MALLASSSIERDAMRCSAARLMSTPYHWAHLVTPHLYVACSVLVRVYLDVMTLRHG
jgi:hypothetical protein